MVRLATPISHLFEDDKTAAEIIKHSDVLESRDETLESPYPNQEVFHCELQIQHRLNDRTLSYMENIHQSKKDLKLISFHMASSYTHPILRKGIFQVGGEQISRSEMKDIASENVAKFRDIFAETTIAIENNNYYPNPAYEHIADPEFISEIVQENNLSFLYDIAHAKISAHNKQMEFDEYKSKLPMASIIQVHICKSDIDDENIAFDAHHSPDEVEFNEVKDLLLKHDTIEYLTIEYYKDKERLINSLQLFKQLCNELH